MEGHDESLGEFLVFRSRKDYASIKFYIFKRKYPTHILGEDDRPGRFHKEAYKISMSKILFFLKFLFGVSNAKKKKKKNSSSRLPDYL